MELFCSVLSCADTTLRIVSRLRTQFEAYKRCPSVLQDILSRAARLRAVLQQYEEDGPLAARLRHPISPVSRRILEHIAQKFASLTIRLEKLAQGLTTQSRMARFLRSSRTSPLLDAILIDLNALDTHMELWEISIHDKDDILTQLCEIKSLLNSPALNDLYHLMTLIGQFLHAMYNRDHIPLEHQEKVAHQLGLLTSQELRNPTIMSFLKDDVPGFLQRLQNKNINPHDKMQIFNRLRELWETLEHPSGRARSAAYEIDITGRELPLHRERRRYSSQGDGRGRWRTVALPPPLRMDAPRRLLPAWTHVVPPSIFSAKKVKTENGWESSSEGGTSDDGDTTDDE